MEPEQILKIKEKQLITKQFGKFGYNGRVTQFKMLLGRVGIDYILNLPISKLINFLSYLFPYGEIITLVWLIFIL